MTGVPPIPDQEIAAEPPTRGRPFRLARWGCVLWLLLFPATTFPAESPYRVEAAFLRNFSHYVTWPVRPLAGGGAPWRICVLGPDPFGALLERALAGRTEQGRPFEIFRAQRTDHLPACDIAYIAYRDDARRRAALAGFRGKPVLTVGESPDFLQQGGIIQFEVGERVKISVNLDQARTASLTIQTKMLEVSDLVVEGGQVRRLR